MLRSKQWYDDVSPQRFDDTSIDTAGPRAVSSQFDAQGEMPIIQIEFQKSECIICKLS